MASTEKKARKPYTKVRLTPGQRREKERKQIASSIDVQHKRAKKIKKDIDKLKEVILEEKPTKAGRVYDQDAIDALSIPTKALAEDNILFKPNEGPQTDFLAAPERDVLYGGQAGGGKSYSLIIDPLRYAHRPAHRALLLRKTLGELGELIDNTRELYPKAFPGAQYKEAKKTWVFPSGAKLYFGYLEKDSDVYQYQGLSFSWIGFDELTHLPTEFAWNYLASRLRTTDSEIKCYMRSTTNPGGIGHSWVKKRYIDAAPANTAFEYGINKQTGAKLYRKFIPARLKDNPYLFNDGDYQSMLETLPEVERRRLLEGDWNINEGIAFPEFHRESHVIDPFDIPMHWQRFKAIDYGYAAPSACLWFAVDPNDGTILCYRELYAKGLTPEALGQLMIDMEVDDVISIPGVLDGAVWNRIGYTGPTIGQTLCSPPYSHKLRPADKNRIAGKIQIHERLKKVGEGRPGLQIFNHCINLVRELESLPLDKNKPEDVDTKAEDHAYDALRYGMMSRPRKESTFDLMQHLKEKTMYEVSDNIFGY
jgi:hypothetical protein